MKTQRTCSIDGCEKKHLARGYCAFHYQSWRSHGDPLKAHPRGTLSERFWRYVDRRGVNECWEWTRARAHYGHGITSVNRRSQLTHRVAWMLTHGAIPEGLCVLHTCDNPPCCNPAHLYVGTQQDNIRDMHERGRYRKIGHAEFGSRYRPVST